jgi:phospholipid/cholesterol/gamma-HCH transport system substrate-binding protein
MGRSLVETVLGAVVLVVAVVFVFYAYDASNIRAVDGYEVSAKFYGVDGLTGGSDVRVSGVKVGTVTNLKIDFDAYQAVVTMSITPDLKLATDTRASVTGEGLLGGKYIMLEPGSGKEMIADGGEITDTKDVVSVEVLLGKAIFLLSEE